MRVSVATRRRLRLSANRVEVRPTIPEDRPARREQLPGRRYHGRLRTPPLRHPVVEPGHRSIVPEMHQGGLHHRPPQPRRPLPGDTPVAGDLPSAVGAGDDPSVARQVVAAPEPADVADLGLHQEGYVVPHTGYRHEEPHDLVPGRDVPELQGQPSDHLPQRRHHPEVALDMLQPHALEPLPPLPGVRAVPLRRLDSLVGEDSLDLHLELGPLPDEEGPSADLLPEHGDVGRGM